MRLLILLFTILSLDLKSQCSMCRAVVETSSGPSLAQGLNNGILYLMSMPYIFLIISCLLYYTYKKNSLRCLRNEIPFMC